jgi:hypothetical protein
LLFLLKDTQGRPLLMTLAGSKAEADEFGRSHLPEFCGDSVELDQESRVEAEQFWGVRTVRVVNMELDPNARTRSVTAVEEEQSLTATRIWVRGPQLPEEVSADDLLTPEDHRDLTLDHIARTCEVVVQIQIRKWA